MVKNEKLIKALSSAGLTNNGKPNFKKIAEITGLRLTSVRSMLAPSKKLPRWACLAVYIAENQKHDSWVDEFEPWQGKIEERDVLGDLTNVVPGDWVLTDLGEVQKVHCDFKRSDLIHWPRFATKEEVTTHLICNTV